MLVEEVKANELSAIEDIAASENDPVAEDPKASSDGQPRAKKRKNPELKRMKRRRH